MTDQTIINRVADDTLVGAGPMILNDAEWQLKQRATSTFSLAPWLNTLESSGIRSAIGSSLFYAAPVVTDTFPTRRAYGGPDDAPYFYAGSSDPVGGLRTPSSIVNVAGDWSVSFVGRASNNASGAIMGIEGDNGGGLGFVLRTSDLFRVTTYDSAGSDTTVQDVAATTADWHHIVVSYDLSETELKIWVDGSLLATKTTALTLNSSRLTLFTAYDPNASSPINADADTSRLASVWVVNEYAGGADATLLDLFDAAAEARFPSIFV